MAFVQLSDVSVTFPIYDAGSRSLKRRAMAAMTGGRVKSETGGRITTDAGRRIAVHALKDIDLTIEHGTRLGLIGLNGAGKSTLLHVIGGIYVPERGDVRVEGKIAGLMSSSLGIDPELSGRENIELRGLYLGLSRAEIKERLEEVIDFTAIGPFIDMPFRTYSAGMRARLDFAISTSIQAEILLLDERLGVGDASFVEKARERLERLTAGAGIIVFASHSEALLREMCTRAVLLEAGRIVAVGDIDAVLTRYTGSRERK